MKLSARNRLAGTVVSINRGEAIANVALDVGGQRIVASITVEAVDELGLREGTSATAVIKASDVMVAVGSRWRGGEPARSRGARRVGSPRAAPRPSGSRPGRQREAVGHVWIPTVPRWGQYSPRPAVGNRGVVYADHR